MTLGNHTLEEYYTNKNILVTGGKGFIGSHLADKLIQFGADITILDSDRECSGSNDHNIENIKHDVEFISGDVVDIEDVEKAMRDKDAVFHTAAQVSRVKSQENPVEDTKTNCEGTLNILEAAKALPKDPRVVFTSSRAVYGSPDKIPVPETAPINPVDIYAANKAAAESYCKIYNSMGDVSCTIARLTNVFGPRAQISNTNYGVLNLFVRYAVQNEEVTVYKPGTMKRDVIYVKDVVSGLLTLGSSPETEGEIFNLGSGEVYSIKEIAEEIVGTAESGQVVMTGWPSEWEKMEVGNFASDNSKITEVTGWTPSYTFQQGLKETVSFYQDNIDIYLE